jgi:hypothetical protein
MSKRHLKPSSEDKVIIHELQIRDVLEDTEVITNPEDSRPSKISLAKAKADSSH